MATPTWQPGTLYQPGAVVQRTTGAPVATGGLTNGSFEDGVNGWTSNPVGGVSTLQSSSVQHFVGAKSAQWLGGIGSGNEGGIETFMVSDDRAPVVPGQTLTGSSYIKYNTAGHHNGSQGRTYIYWFDENQAYLSRTAGILIRGKGNNNKWVQSTVSGAAPANAAFAAMAVWMTCRSGNIFCDNVVWNYTYAAPPSGLVFRAVQPNPGYSDSTEPVWPNTVGQQVIDNDVVWEAINSSRIVWEAHPILMSGANEPDWPSIPGAVADNTISWQASSRRIEDERCPQSKIVVIAASKIFAADEDIIRFSATVNPLDWSTPDNAGYLPFGLQTYGAQPVAAMGLYRSNLVAFNAQAFQMWQVDEDPVNMALLDAVPVACTEHQSAQPSQNDLIFLNPVGIRNISIAGASTNIQAGTFGEVIDPLVREKVKEGLYDPIAINVPAFGQYWLVFGPEAFVLTLTDTKTQSWSRYTFPEAITDWTIEDQKLLLRTETGLVWEVTEDEEYDDVHDGYSLDFDSWVWWPHLDCGNLGVEKQLVAFDVVSTAPEGLYVSIGYDQRDLERRTTDYFMEGDSLPGKSVPFPVSGPSFDLRIRFEPGQAWELDAACFYVQDWRTTS